MKRLLIFVLAMSGVGLSQTSAVSATITDPDSQTWNNGSYTISFVPTPGIPGPYTWQGNPNFPTNYTGTFSGSGLLAVSIPDNSFIAPLGSKWQFTLCSNTSAPCQNVTLSVTGVAPNLSAALSGPLVAPRFGAGQFAFGYLDIEVTGTLAPGNFYFNVTNLIQRIWNGSTWVNNAGGGGGTITGSGTANSFTGWNGPTSLTNAPATYSGLNSFFSGSISAGSGASCGTGATGCVAMTEAATAGTPSAGVDYIRADSVSHTLKCSQNGAAETGCIGAGGGVTGSGTTGTIPEWTSSTALGNSPIVDGGTTGITTTIPSTGAYTVVTGSTTGGSVLLNGTGGGTTSYIGSTPFAQFGANNGSGCTFLTNGTLVCRATNTGTVTSALNLSLNNAAGGPTWSLGDSVTQVGLCGIATGGSGTGCFGHGTVSAGVEFAVPTGAQFTFRVNGVAAATLNGSSGFQVSAVNFSTLTTCLSVLEGSTAAIKDSTTNTWGATITGGGANHVLAYCDGTNWTVAAK